MKYSCYIVLFVIYVVLKIQYVSADVVSSTLNIESLVETQRSVMESLEKYIAYEEKRLAAIERYVLHFEAEYSRAMENVSNYIGNPMTAYTLIKRLTFDIYHLENMHRSKRALRHKKGLKYPSHKDYVGAVNAIHLLQDTYDLNISDLANGMLKSNFSENSSIYIESASPMLASDCVELGTVKDGTNYHERSSAWLKEALNKVRRGEHDIQVVDEAYVMDYIVYVYYLANDTRSQQEWITNRIQLQPLDTTKSKEENIILYLQMFLKQNYTRMWKDIYMDNWINRPGMKSLCHGGKAIIKSYTCWYKNGPHPFLRLAPIKTEQLSRTPDILMYHDVIYDAEIQSIIELAKNKMTRSSVKIKKDTNNEGEKSLISMIVDYRVSQIVWLPSGLSPVLKRLTARTSHFTGLSMDSAEALQVANYGLGGYYDMHFDYTSGEDLVIQNDRIATVLFYMSDVEQGGATAFKTPKLTVFPKKGAALYWRNLLPSGEVDTSTMHSGCPVLRGSKWASIYWIHEAGQKLVNPARFKESRPNIFL